MHYIKHTAIKKLVKVNGKRTSKKFLEALDRYVEKKIIQAVNTHNGGRKTLDAGIAGYILGNK
jgi:hypothetical protein